MSATPQDLRQWQRSLAIVQVLRSIADRTRPDLFAADVEVDVLLTWLDSAEASTREIIARIEADLTQTDQIESGDAVRDTNGDIVAVSYSRYP